MRALRPRLLRKRCGLAEMLSNPDKARASLSDKAEKPATGKEKRRQAAAGS